MKKYLPFIFFALISLIITFNLFNEGKIISNSEESLNIIYPFKTFGHYKTIWSPVEAGILNPFNLPRIPLFFALSIIEILSLPNFLGQALIFFWIIFVSLLGMYFLTKHIFKGSLNTSLISALFYTLNLFTLAQVFRRLLYSGFFAFAYLPLFLLFWIKFVENKKIKWLFLLLVSNLLFSTAYGHPAYLMAIWSTGAIFTCYELIIKNSYAEKLKILIYSVLGLIGLVIVNIWWIYPFTVSSSSYISEVHGAKNQNFELLKGVSPSFDTFQILLLRQKWWYGLDQHWGWFYSNPVIIFVSVIGLLLMAYGLFSSRKKLPFFGFLISLFLVGWFISKGTNPPLGETFFYYLFNLIPATGSLRNSYEKFGLVFLIPYSIFFAFGLHALSKKIKVGKVLTFLVVFLFCGILVYPFWLDSIYLKSEKVSIPNYYKEADAFLDSQNNGKLFHIPHPRFSNVKYNWGLYGQEPSEFLFDRRSMVNSENMPLKLAFNNSLNQSLEKQLGCLNVTNIVLHNEAFEEKEDIKITRHQFKSWKDTKYLANFGELEIYKLNEDLVKPQVFKVSTELRKESFDNFCRTNNFSSVDIVKASDDEYNIKIPDVQEDFILVLNENYHPFWRLSINGKNYQENFKIFEYANGWEIKEKDDLNIKIKFVVWPFD